MLIHCLTNYLDHLSYSMFCPSMCSGKGICDWSSLRPTCKCFDELDETKGCYDSAVVEQAVCSTSSGYKTSFTAVALMFPVLALVTQLF